MNVNNELCTEYGVTRGRSTVRQCIHVAWLWIPTVPRMLDSTVYIVMIPPMACCTFNPPDTSPCADGGH